MRPEMCGVRRFAACREAFRPATESAAADFVPSFLTGAFSTFFQDEQVPMRSDPFSSMEITSCKT